ncbi:DHHA1 domain-containing protein [Candidatus Bathyarchaeota archaeon]|nr:DHHA1 domain-containing protein [Candidatus Bathyarchaeota archaeon]
MRTWIFAHGDSDGICSGAIALATNLNAKVFFTNPYGLVEDLNSAEEDDEIIICDIALSEDRLDKTLHKFSSIAERGSLTYIDHHPLPEAISKDDMPGRIVHSLDSSTSELAYSLYQSELNPLLARVAIFGAIGDYQDNTPTIRNLLKRMDKRTLYFESGILVQGIDGQKRNYELKRKIISNLAHNTPPSAEDHLVELAVEQTRLEESAIREIVTQTQVKGKIAYLSNFPFSQGKTAIYAMGLTDALVGIACEDWKDTIDMSLRTFNPEIDLNDLLRRIVPKLGGSGGGHKGAAGARIPKRKFKIFLDELNKHLIQEL